MVQVPAVSAAPPRPPGRSGRAAPPPPGRDRGGGRCASCARASTSSAPRWPPSRPSSPRAAASATPSPAPRAPTRSLLALLAVGVGPGDEVDRPRVHHPRSTPRWSRSSAAVPRFAEIDPLTFTLDPARLAEQVTARTRAVIVTHLYGLPADMDGHPRRRRARTASPSSRTPARPSGAAYRGRPAGGLGDVGCFSFFPTKNLGACGDGGALTTDDPKRAAQLRRLRNHGARAKYVHEAVGLNSRLDEVQAAVLRVKLRHLEAWLAPAPGARRALRRRPRAASGVTLPARLPDREGNHHQYTSARPGVTRCVRRSRPTASRARCTTRSPPSSSPSTRAATPRSGWPFAARARGRGALAAPLPRARRGAHGARDRVDPARWALLG